jgi:uncharacterized small protein (DUF1192 family)
MRIVKSVEILNNGYCNILYNDFADDTMTEFVGNHRECKHISEVKDHQFSVVAGLDAVKDLFPAKDAPVQVLEVDAIQGKIAILEQQIMAQKAELFLKQGIMGEEVKGAEIIK